MIGALEILLRQSTGDIMTGRLDGKVAFITGAARGQGRSHAVRFAEEGADIIALDLCAQIDCVAYPMATPEDLDETVNLVEKTGRRIVAEQGDVRDLRRLQAVVADGIAELGRLDFVLANAGILPVFPEQANRPAAFHDSIDVMLKGVYFTIEAALPALLANPDGGAVVITSSTAGLASLCEGLDGRNHGLAGYTAAKHGVVGLMRYYATALAEKNIRVNTVHPCGVASPMLVNDITARMSAADPTSFDAMKNLLDVDMIEEQDITEAMLYLCGRSGRYITGTTLTVDAGYLVKVK
jgi:SDR family mycofactocin-dependent oxidoreductase